MVGIFDPFMGNTGALLMVWSIRAVGGIAFFARNSYLG
ncbi:hypothetical protein C4J83_0552 [Pseudomonas sp. LBUM920]|nr:hypothetical protein C4J83_0552 [Pseudomonas sp. LBUM920]